jgi:putative redox protein
VPNLAYSNKISKTFLFCDNILQIRWFIDVLFVIDMDIYKAQIRDAGDGFFIGTTPSGTSITLDTKGDRHSAPSPLELLLVAVGSCTAVDVAEILQKKRQDVTEYKIEVSGSRREEHPRSFETMNVHHIVYGRSVSEKAVADAINLSVEKYCSVAANLRPTTTITSSFEIIEV